MEPKVEEVKKKAQNTLKLKCLLSEPPTEKIKLQKMEIGWYIECNACHLPEPCIGFITKNLIKIQEEK